MCGIVGYTGVRPAQPLLLDGLSALEYRGYDSAGIATVSADGEVLTTRAVGNLAALRARVAECVPVLGSTPTARPNRSPDAMRQTRSDAPPAPSARSP